MRRDGGDVSEAPEGLSFHTLVLPLAADADACRALEARFEAGFQVYRAVLREGLRRLDLLRQSRAWRAARSLPASTPQQVRIRNRALNAARVAHGLDENDLKAWARQARWASGWLAEHVDAAVAEQLAGRAWKAVAGHVFDGKGRPRLPRRYEFTSLDGVARNAKSRAWQSITLRGRYDADLSAGPLPDRGVDEWAGPLTVVWNAKRGTSRILAVPVRTHRLSPTGSHARRREEHALTRPESWRAARLVRRRMVTGTTCAGCTSCTWAWSCPPGPHRGGTRLRRPARAGG
jgi:hypothetical protein